MRTKVLICAAAVAAFTAFTSMAQNVYSLNVVGYVNIPVVSGFNLLANPLDLDGYGTNNYTSSVFSNSLPKGSSVYTWNAAGASWNIATYGKSGTWVPDISLNPGAGFWLSLPSGGGVSNVLAIGNVLQGSLVNPYLKAGGGFAIVGSQVPIAGKVQTDLKYAATKGDTLYFWNTTLSPANWDIYTYGKAGWSGTGGEGTGEPTVGIGQGFWLNSQAASTWSNYFTVQ